MRILHFVIAVMFLLVAACSSGPAPNTHTGDASEPPWVLNPDLASGSYPGAYIFASGTSRRGLQDKNVARRQAEANARNAISQRLSELCSSKVIQWSRDQSIGEATVSASEIRTMSTNISVEFLSNCDIPEYWVSGESGEYAALARLPFSTALRKMRDEVNAVLAERVADSEAVRIHTAALNKEFGLPDDEAVGTVSGPDSTLSIAPR